MSYKIKLEIFEGPLDLLLYLIKKNEMDIYEISISTILEQYLEYLELMRLFDLNIAGDFLVLAATLMQIKSKMLLPQDADPLDQILDEEPDPRAELVKRLLEYQQYKEAAQILRSKEQARKDLFKRPGAGSEAAEETFLEASLFDLISAFSRALKDMPKEFFLEVVKDEFTVEGKVHELLHLFVQTSRIKISELFSRAKNKLETIAVFLAVLELIRLKEISVIQSSLFGEVEVSRKKENMIAIAQ